MGPSPNDIVGWNGVEGSVYAGRFIINAYPPARHPSKARVPLRT